MTDALDDRLERTLAAYRDTFDQRTPFPRVPREGVVRSVRLGQNQTPLEATVEIPGEPLVTVELLGSPMSEGQPVRLFRNADQAVDPAWSFGGYLPGVVALPSAYINADIPAPTWRGPAFTTAVETGQGGQFARITAHLTETSENFQPLLTQIEWRTSASPGWQSTTRVNEGGIDAPLDVDLGLFQMGVTVSVRAYSVTALLGRSDYSETRQVIAEADIVPLPQPAAFQVNTDTHLTLTITLPDPPDPARFDFWQLEVAQSAGGASAQTITIYGGKTYQYRSLDERDYWLRLRAVGKGGLATASPWQPASGYSGPFRAVATTTPPSDTQPPNVPTISNVFTESEIVQGQLEVNVVVDLAAYSFPPDFKSFQVRYGLTSGNGVPPTDYDDWGEYGPVLRLRRRAVKRGQWYAIQARAWDVNGNASAWKPDAFWYILTPNPAQPPSSTMAPIVTAGFRGARLEWKNWYDTLSQVVKDQIGQFEVQRSLDTNNPNASVTIGYTDAIMYVDTMLGVATWYGWRYRPVGRDGNPAQNWSPWGVAQTKAVEDGDIFGNTISGNKMIAGSIHGDRITARTVDADRLNAPLILTGEVRATNPGIISAGNGGVTLNQSGLNLFGKMVNFYQGATLRAQLEAVGSYVAHGNPGVRVLLDPNVVASNVKNYLYLTSESPPALYAYDVLGGGEHQAYHWDTGGFYDHGGLWQNSLRLGYYQGNQVVGGCRFGYFAAEGISVGAGTFTRGVLQYNLPRHTKAVYMRAFWGGPNFVWIYGNRNNRETGLFLADVSHEHAEGWVPCSWGDDLNRADGDINLFFQSDAGSVGSLTVYIMGFCYYYDPAVDN